MPPNTIHEAPSLDSFTPLAEHQSQTPATFYDAKPVLHYHSSVVRALISHDQASQLPIFSLELPAASTISAEVDEADAIARTQSDMVDVYVSSENVTLFNPDSSAGISIPYPAISLHAIKTLPNPANPAQQVRGLYMQLELVDHSEFDDPDDQEPIELTLIPPIGSDSATSSIQSLFEAVSSCSNLHPDPEFDGDEDFEDSDDRIIFEGNVGYEGISGLPGVSQGAQDGGLPPPFPGSGGWITAENVSEYFDEEGNWIGGADSGNTLGEGAGRVRTRDERDSGGVNGHDEHESDESKRPRTD